MRELGDFPLQAFRIFHQFLETFRGAHVEEFSAQILIHNAFDILFIIHEVATHIPTNCRSATRAFFTYKWVGRDLFTTALGTFHIEEILCFHVVCTNDEESIDIPESPFCHGQVSELGYIQ